MTQLVHLALAQLKPRKGDYAGNLQRLAAVFAQLDQFEPRPMVLCQDAWHSVTATIAALDAAQIIFVCAAPPARGIAPKTDEVPGPASASRWDRLIRDIADEHGVFVTLTCLTGSEGGKIFPGGSFVAGPKGDVRGRAPVWNEAILTATIDLADVTRARADMPLIADLETMVPHLRESLDRAMAGAPTRCEYDPAAIPVRG